MTSERLLQYLSEEARRLQQLGLGNLVVELIRLEDKNVPTGFEEYLSGLANLRQRCSELGEDRFEYVLRYLLGRTFSFPLDRPREALPYLVPLQAELAQSDLQEGTLHLLTELEVYRAYHKIDAPGYRDALSKGMHRLWSKLKGDLGSRVELLDVWWRTGYWCGDADFMEEGLSLAYGQRELMVSSWPYWQARMLSLRGQHSQAVEILQGILQQRRLKQIDEGVWVLYVEAELALALVRNGRIDEAQERLQTLKRRCMGETDPMLLWNLARAQAEFHHRVQDSIEEVEAWRRGLEVLENLGLERLRGEFAVALGEAAQNAGRKQEVAQALKILDELWSHLRSRADLIQGRDRLRASH